MLLHVGPIRSDRATVPRRSQILAGMKTKTSEDSEGAHTPTSKARSVGLGCILDQENAPFLALMDKFLHRSRLAIQMNRQEHLCLGIDCCESLTGVHQEGVRVCVDQCRFQSCQTNGCDRRVKCVGGSQNFVLRAKG